MSGRHVGIVFRHSKHAASELLVLASIAEALNEKSGTWYMSVSQIATRCKLSDRHVFRILLTLRESNELGMRKGGPLGQNVFWLKLQPSTGEANSGSTDVLPMTPASEATEEIPKPGVTAEYQMPGSHMTRASGRQALGLGQCASLQGHEEESSDTTVTPEMTTSTEGHDTAVSGSMTSVTPITRHSEKHTTSPGPSRSDSDPAETMARLLRERGVENVKVTKEFRQAVHLGATVASLSEAIAESGHAGNPFAYGVKRDLNSLRTAETATVKQTVSSKPGDGNMYTEDPALQKIKREAILAVPVPAFVRELSRKLRAGGG